MHKHNDGHIDPLKARLSNAMYGGDNKLCQECLSRGPHTWASWNLGVLLCIRCAGIHRKLGVHISKVKSCTLDQWQREQVDSLVAKGNKQVWLYYEHNLPKGYTRPNDTSSLEVFIRNKYERKLYIPRDGSVSLPGEQAPDPSPAPEPSKSSSKRKESKGQEKKASTQKGTEISKSSNSLAIPANSISRPRSQPSSPAKPQDLIPEKDSLLLDVGTGMTASRSESDFAFIDNIEKLFGVESKPPQSKQAPPPNFNTPTQNQGIDFLEPLVQASSNPQMNTNQIMSLYNARPQPTTGRMGAPIPPKFAPPHPRYPPNAPMYREQQQKMVKDVADIQNTINSIKVPGGPLPVSQPANGTDDNDPWEQPALNGMSTQSGKTLSQDLWL